MLLVFSNFIFQRFNSLIIIFYYFHLLKYHFQHERDVSTYYLEYLAHFFSFLSLSILIDIDNDPFPLLVLGVFDARAFTFSVYSKLFGFFLYKTKFSLIINNKINNS